MKFDPKDWISPKKALKKIVEMIKVNQERLDDYKKKHPKSKYFEPEQFGFGANEYEAMNSFTEAYDWNGFTFNTDTASTEKAKIGFTGHDIFNVPPHQQEVTTTTTAGMAATTISTTNNFNSIDKYLANELLTNDAEAALIVRQFYESCILGIFDNAGMHKKERVLSEIELNDPNNQIKSSMKLIIQLLLDVCQVQLEVKPLTINNSCKYDTALQMAWDMIGCVDDDIAQSLLLDNAEQVNWLTSELFEIEFVQNLLKSKRYGCEYQSWIELGLEDCDGVGYRQNDNLAGIFTEGVAFRGDDLLNIIENDAQLLSKFPLVVLRQLRYTAECAFYFLNGEAGRLSASSILYLIGIVYGIGNKMNWSWFVDLITSVHLDAVVNNYTTQSNLGNLINIFCAVGAAWRAIGHLGGFKAHKLINNHDLKELWLTLVICALVTIINKILQLERDFETLDSLFHLLAADNQGMFAYLCIIFVCYWYILFCLFVAIYVCDFTLLVQDLTKFSCREWTQNFKQYQLSIINLTNRHCVLATPIYKMEWTHELIKKCEFWQHQMNNRDVENKPQSLDFSEADCKIMDQRWNEQKNEILDKYADENEQEEAQLDAGMPQVNESSIEIVLENAGTQLNNDSNSINQSASSMVNTGQQAQAEHESPKVNAQSTVPSGQEQVHEIPQVKSGSIIIPIIPPPPPPGLPPKPQHAQAPSLSAIPSDQSDKSNSATAGTIDANASINHNDNQVSPVNNAQDGEFSVTPIPSSLMVVDNEDNDLTEDDMKYFRQTKISGKLDFSNDRVHIVRPMASADIYKYSCDAPVYNHQWMYNDDSKSYNHKWCKYNTILGTNGKLTEARVGQIVYFRSSMCNERRKVKIVEMQATTADSQGGIWKVREINKKGEEGNVIEAHSFNFSKLKEARMFIFDLCIIVSIINQTNCEYVYLCCL